MESKQEGVKRLFTVCLLIMLKKKGAMLHGLRNGIRFSLLQIIYKHKRIRSTHPILMEISPLQKTQCGTSSTAVLHTMISSMLQVTQLGQMYDLLIDKPKVEEIMIVLSQQMKSFIKFFERRYVYSY